jgi:hypothetical protein
MNVQDGVSSFLFNVKDYWSPRQKATKYVDDCSL